MGEKDVERPEDDEIRQRKARRASFLDLSLRLREWTKGTYQTPGWVLIREYRDSDHEAW